jgi:signal peptidase II
MHQGEARKFIPGFLNFEYILNPGSAYGFNAQNLALAVSLATIITLILIVGFVFVNAHA